jgi:hypothetical protein
MTRRHTNYETADIQVTIDGVVREGHFRVVNGSVIVYYGSEVKFATHGMTQPETLARWLLTDLCRQVDARRKKHGA